MSHNEEIRFLVKGVPENYEAVPFIDSIGRFGIEIQPIVPSSNDPDQEEFNRAVSEAWNTANRMTSDEDEFPVEEAEQALAEQAEKKPVAGDLEDGYYYTEIFDPEHEEGGFVEVWKVVTSQTSGRPYAKKLEMKEGTFNYTPGVMKWLKVEATPLSLEIAKKYGALYGRCMICGRTLTDETSIANGIGPICADRI